MPRKPPKYMLHKPSGQAHCTTQVACGRYRHIFTTASDREELALEPGVYQLTEFRLGQEISQGFRILPRANFFVRKINLEFTNRGTDADVQRFNNARRLDWLSLNGSAVSIQGLHALAGLPISELYVSSTRLQYADLPAIVADFPQLTRLDLRQLKGERGQGFAPLASLPQLNFLELDATHVLAEPSELAQLAELKTIRISGQRIPVPASVISALDQIPHVESLVLALSSLEADVYETLSQNSTLTSLEINNCQIDGRQVELLASMSRLQVLKLYGMNSTHAGMEKLSFTLPHCHIQWNGGQILPSQTSDSDRRVTE